jgi:hypothetical protein
MQKDMVIFIAGAFSMLGIQILLGAILCSLRLKAYKPNDAMSGDSC